MKEALRLNINTYQFGNTFDIDLNSVKTNLFFLIGIFSVFTIGIAMPYTRETTRWILDENKIVEVLTFVFFLFAGGLGLNYCRQLIKDGENLLILSFYFLFSVGLILIGMEEISWGQQFFGWATPESFRAINDQGETTLHNIKGMSGNSEYLRLIYGICGAIGVFLYSYKPFRKVAAPIFLLPWFLMIVGHSVVDVFNDIVPIDKNFDALISELAELVEMLIAMSALLFIYFKVKTNLLDEKDRLK
jgi:hypothetical protein